MQFSPKQKAFSQCFAAFLKITLNFKHFEWKYDSHRFCVFEIMDSENVVRWMTKKSHFREPFDKQHGKGAQALFKSESHHLYNIHWSLLRQLSCKKSLLLTCQILGLLVNTLAADEKYPVLNTDNLTIPIQMQLSQKEKTFSEFFVHFWNLSEILNAFKKKRTLRAFVFPKFPTPKSWSDKCLKSLVSEDASKNKMVNAPKHCWNLYHSTFLILIGHWQGNCGQKSLPYLHAKSWDCLLKDWLTMEGILFLIETI